jgi:hypothetical protein
MANNQMVFVEEITDEEAMMMVVASRAPKPKLVMLPDFETRFKTAVHETETKLLAEEIALFQKLRARARKLPDPDLECPFVVSMCWAIHHCGPNRVMQLFGGQFANFFKLSWLPVMSSFKGDMLESSANTMIAGMTDLLFGDGFMTVVVKDWGMLRDDWARGIESALSLIQTANEAKVDISENEQRFKSEFGKTLNQYFEKFSERLKQSLIQICRDHKIDPPNPDQLSIKDHEQTSTSSSN